MIVGERVRLRAVERDDLPNFVRWFNDSDVLRYLLTNQPMSMAQEERWFEAQLDRKSGFVYSIDVLDSGEWIHAGSIGLHTIDWKNRWTEFGISIGEKKYWSQGFGTEATQLMVRFAFEELNLNRVQLDVYDFNERARRTYEKVGFKQEGVKRQALYREGSYHDVLLMSILRDEYGAQRDSG